LHGQNLERLLHISSTNDIESDDEDIEQIEDTALRSDDSDAGLEEANAGFQLSPKDKKAYEEFRSAEIFCKHLTDRGLQNRTSHMEMERMQSSCVRVQPLKTLSVSTTASTSSIPIWSILSIRNGLGRTACYVSLDAAEGSSTNGTSSCTIMWDPAVAWPDTSSLSRSPALLST
jgi:hypothetical protein